MLDPAFTLAGSPVSWLEAWAFVLALAGVALTVWENHWGWPFSIAASALYAWLFFINRLYGDAALQLFFIAISIWGWRAWLLGGPPGQGGEHAPGEAGRLPIRRLRPLQALALLASLLAAWLVLGALLARYTDTDVPWFDGFPTAGSLIAQTLLARKLFEAWPLWIVVNAVAMALFAWKALWLTVLLYALLLGLSGAGLMRWRKRLGSP